MTVLDITEFMANAAKAEAAMNYPRCATCKWFTPWREAELDYYADLPDGWGVCTLITADYELQEDPSAKALLMQQWSEHSDMATAPDFGCVQHEPRDEPEDAT